MKRTAFLLAALAAVAGVCSAGDNPLAGTWELVSMTATASDGTKTEAKAGKDGFRSIKIYSETHYAVVTHGSDGTFSNASAGTYAVKGDTFAETLQNSSNPENVGTEWVHEFSVSGDLLTNSWVSPVTGAKAKEVWKRVK